MNKLTLFLVAVALVAITGIAYAGGSGCGYGGEYKHKGLNAYNVPLGDVDGDGNGIISREEYVKRYGEVKADGFTTIDGNGDGGINEQEWRAFKEVHGLGGKHSAAYRSEKHGSSL